MKNNNIVNSFLDYLSLGGISPGSLKYYKSDLVHLLNFVTNIEQINKISLKKYIKSSIATSSTQTTNRRLSTLRKFAQFLVDLNIKNVNFMQGIKNIGSTTTLQGSKLSKLQKFDTYLIDQKISKNTRKGYLSDVNKFLSWQKRPAPDGGETGGGVKQYLNENLLGLSKATYSRLVSSLKKYYEFKSLSFPKRLTIPKIAPYAHLQEWILNKFDSKELLQKRIHNLFFSRPKWYRRYHTYPIANYVHYAILIVFCTIAGYGVYDQVIRRTDISLAYPATAETPNRYLSFQGRLTDNLSNPITTSTNIVFKLYDDPSAGSTLWDSTTCAITPDSDGIFSTLLGSTCGGAIASSVFSENADVWLGVTVAGDSEATPRIQIATVGYALNSETLQGFPLGTGTSTVPYIDSTGKLAIAAASPTLESSSGTFGIVGQAMTISTADTTNGSIAINPDGTGSLDVTFEGAASGASNGFLNVTNANITSGALIGGTVASAATGYNFIDFQSGVSPSSVFSIDSTGATTANTLNLTGNTLYSAADLTIDPTGGGVKIGTGTPGTVDLAGDDLYVTADLEVDGTIYGNITGNLTCTDCLDFSHFEDTLDLDDNLILNQSTYTWTQNYTGTTGVGLTYNANSLTTGTSFSLASTSTDGGESGSTKLLNLTRSGTNSNASHTAYGLYSAVTNTGTTSTNVAGYFSASGATNNYGLLVNAGNVGIGTTTPSYPLSITTTDKARSLDISATVPNPGLGSNSYGIYNDLSSSYSGSNTGQLTGIRNDVTATDDGIDIASFQSYISGNKSIYGIYFDSYSTSTGGGTFNQGGYFSVYGNPTSYGINISSESDDQDAYGVFSDTTSYAKKTYGIYSIASGAIIDTSYAGYLINNSTNSTTDGVSKYGLYITSTGNFPGLGGTATNNYGLYINTPTGADNNYAAIFAGGNVGVGDTTPDASLDVTGDIYVSNGISLFENSISDGYIEATGFCTGDGEGNCVTDFSALGGASSVWSDLTDPGGNLTLNMTTYTTEFNWDTGTSTNNLLSLTTDASSNGTGYLLNLATGASSAVQPLGVSIGGSDALKIDASGQVTIGTASETHSLSMDDLLIASDLELDGVLYLDGGNISNSTGTAFISFATNNLYLNSTNDITILEDPSIQLSAANPTITATGTNSTLGLAANGTGTLTFQSGATGNIQFFSSSNTLSSTGTLTLAGDAAVNGGDLTTTNATASLFDTNATTLNIGGAATTINFGDPAVASKYVFDTGVTTETAFDLSVDGLTTGTGLLIDDNTAAGLSSGTLLQVQSVSTDTTAITDGMLAYYNWDPGSATTKSGDLLRLNVGQYGNVGNLLNITDNGSTLFRVSETQIESAVPHAFTAAGDISIAYDAVFTNQTASTIQSYGPLTIASGESFENNNLTFQTYGTGDFIFQGGNIKIALDNEASRNYALCVAVDDGGATPGTTLQEVDDCDSAVTADYAEMYPTAEDVGYGDIVAVSSSLVNVKKVVDNKIVEGEFVSISKLEKASQQYQSNTIGVTSNNYGDFTSTGYNVEDKDHPMPVALSGRIPVKISPSSKSIKIGDYITSSQNPGMGMKAEKSGRVIGIALENWEQNSGKETVNMFINNSWYIPETNLAKNDEKDPSSLIQLLASLGKVFISNLKTRNIETETISPVADSDLIIDLDPEGTNGSSRFVIKGRDDKEVASIDSVGDAVFRGKVIGDRLEVNKDATVSGTLYANDIESKRLEDIEKLLAEVESNQELLAHAQSWDTETSSNEALSTNFSELVTENLFVTGESAVSSLLASDSISLGSDFIIQNNSINTISSPLKLQSLALAPLEVMAGKFKIDTDGNVKIQGNLQVAGQIASEGIVIAQSPIDDNVATQSAEIIQGDIATNATAGTATLPTDTEKIRIVNSKVTKDTLVYITPLSDTQNNVLFVKTKGEGYFDIGFSKAIEQEVNFNWWIIELRSDEIRNPVETAP